MEVEPGDVEKLVRKLRKALKNLPSNLPVEDVHRLRTQARRLEAIVGALGLDRNKIARPMLKAVKTIRKAAGDVRDVDVLTAMALALCKRRGDSADRLLEHLAGMRRESARKLLDTVARQRKDACRSLSRFSKQIGKRLGGNSPGAATEAGRGCLKGDRPLRLIAELQGWPEFDAENLHSYRIRLKELRYVLQLSQDADVELLGALGRVKDKIGDWHDWQQLGNLAKKTSRSQQDRAALKKIETIETEKFKQSLAAANALRSDALGGRSQAGGETPKALSDCA
jgi:CHAD domain-containing protein